MQYLLRGLPTITHLVLDHIELGPPSCNSVLSQLAVDRESGTSSSYRISSLLTSQASGLSPEFAEHNSGLFLFLNTRRSHDAMNVREDSVIFTDPPDSLKELTLSFQRTNRLKHHELDNTRSVRSFEKHCGVLFNVGPLLYSDELNA